MKNKKWGTVSIDTVSGGSVPAKAKKQNKTHPGFVTKFKDV